MDYKLKYKYTYFSKLTNLKNKGSAYEARNR